jgi:CheY-like chemotaxis protein
MARILILQELPGPFRALKTSLEPYHELIFVKNVDEALSVLTTQKIDMIISRVHLEEGSVFEFIRIVKENPQLANLPFICFCGKLSDTAKTLDHALAKAAETLGADKYVSLEHFCSDDDCDYDRLRGEIESCLKHPAGNKQNP